VAKAGETHGLGALPLQTYVGVFQTFSFGDETIKNAQLPHRRSVRGRQGGQARLHIPTAAIDTSDMLLGADFFRSHRVYVSLGRRTVYVSYVGGPVFQTRLAALRRLDVRAADGRFHPCPGLERRPRRQTHANRAAGIG